MAFFPAPGFCLGNRTGLQVRAEMGGETEEGRPSGCSVEVILSPLTDEPASHPHVVGARPHPEGLAHIC